MRSIISSENQPGLVGSNLVPEAANLRSCHEAIISRYNNIALYLFWILTCTSFRKHNSLCLVSACSCFSRWSDWWVLNCTSIISLRRFLASAHSANNAELCWSTPSYSSKDFFNLSHLCEYVFQLYDCYHFEFQHPSQFSHLSSSCWWITVLHFFINKHSNTVHYTFSEMRVFPFKVFQGLLSGLKRLSAFILLLRQFPYCFDISIVRVTVFSESNVMKKLNKLSASGILSQSKLHELPNRFNNRLNQ